MQHGLSLATSMKMKPQVKIQGRPKYSGTVWPKKRKLAHCKENVPPAKKVKSGTDNVSFIVYMQYSYLLLQAFLSCGLKVMQLFFANTMLS